MAQTLCECDGKNWTTIIRAERDRYARIAISVDHRIGGRGGRAAG